MPRVLRFILFHAKVNIICRTMKFGVDRIGRRRAELLFFLLLRVGRRDDKKRKPSRFIWWLPKCLEISRHFGPFRKSDLRKIPQDLGKIS